MKWADVNGKLADYRRQIATIREKTREMLATVESQEVKDYECTNTEGMHLSELGRYAVLIVNHNMGGACSYYTLWCRWLQLNPSTRTHAKASLSRALTGAEEARPKPRLDTPDGEPHRIELCRGPGHGSANGGWMPCVAVYRLDCGKLVRISDPSFSLCGTSSMSCRVGSARRQERRRSPCCAAT